MSRERRTCLFSGHVQGVGFRYTAQDIARHHAVSGYVRNLSDGRVELVAEGECDAIDRLIDSIRQRMGEFIRDIKSSTQPASGEFDSFSIRH